MNRCPGHVGYDYAYASFSNVDYSEDYYANVYNGKKTLDYIKADDSYEFAKNDVTKKLRRQLPDGKNTEDKFELSWEGTHYDFKVIRYMCHLDAANNEYNWEPAPGQYKRTFIGQSKGSIAWETDGTMDMLYEKDRNSARGRLTGKGNYDNAVFATDKLLQQYDYPIKSGYYFNPVGHYKCTVETAQYKNSKNDTEEHKSLVEKVKAAFFYDSSLIYVNSRQQAGKLGDITEAVDRGLLHIDIPLDKKEKSTTWIATTAKRLEEADIEVDDLYKEVMEGYEESHTKDSHELYKYMERTDNTVSGQDIWLVEEKTEIYFRLEVPSGDNRNLYTHVNMKNGEYAVLARVHEIEFDFKDYLGIGRYSEDSVLKLKEFNLDGIKVTVSGSMYDDR
jgi:hypothetical protein